MAHERTYPCLPCADIDGAITFYETLGFARTYRQRKPNPYAVVQREDLQIHLFAIDGFEPERSYGNVIVAVPDADALYQAFATALRAEFGKLPVRGIPRITRPRKRQGTVYGFSVVDPGGNWLRIAKSGALEASEDEPLGPAKSLDGVLALAARLADSHGDDALALRTLARGLQRFPEAPIAERARALLFAAELAFRVGDEAKGRASLALATSLDLSDEQRASLAADFAHVNELLA